MAHLLAGIDEVGRGCWAGPLVAGAVVLRRPIAGLKDSKQLTKLQRERLAVQIQTEALACGLGWVAAAELDELGMTRALYAAYRRALTFIVPAVTEIIIDGAYNVLQDDPRAHAVIRADGSVPAVSAASIIAKVARDRYMAAAAKQFPGYGFERHVGYGTAGHQAALAQLGVCQLHRRSFRPVRLALGMRV